VWPFKWKLLSSTFLWYSLLCCTRWFNFWVCGWNTKVWPFKWKWLSSSYFHYIVQGGSQFWVWGWNPKVWPFKWKLLSSTFLWSVYCAVSEQSIWKSWAAISGELVLFTFDTPKKTNPCCKLPHFRRAECRSQVYVHFHVNNQIWWLNLRVQKLAHFIKFVEDHHSLSSLKSATNSKSGSANCNSHVSRKQIGLSYTGTCIYLRALHPSLLDYKNNKELGKLHRKVSSIY